MTSRSLRPVVIFFASIACIWALVWSSSAFRDIPDDKKDMGGYVTFDIILGSLYILVAVIEAYGVFAAVKARINLVKIYAYLTVATALLVTGIEILHVVLHFTFKDQIIQRCLTNLRGQTVSISNGSIFSGNRVSRPITDAEARGECDSSFNRGTFQDIAWLLVAVILGALFAATTFAYLRQLMDPAMNRSQAPSAAFQMHATRNPYGYNNSNIPGYNPYQTQSYGDYVPPYDANKPPGYVPGPGYMPAGDEKLGYPTPAPGTSRDIEAGGGGGGGGGGDVNPFADPAHQQQAYHPPPGAPPPGLELYAHNSNHDRSKDEGFDTATLEAAMKKSEIETKGPGRNDEQGAGPSSR